MDYHRHSIRLRKWNYSWGGYYFVTICTRKRICLLDKYDELKNILNKQWVNLPKINKNIEIDEFVIMPNHVHGILIIRNVGAGLAPALNKNGLNNGATARVAPTDWTLGKIVGIYKSKCCTEWLKFLKNNKINEIGSFWQRNYYEHIIRNEMELKKVEEYIKLNPMMWNRDRNNPKNLNKTQS